ncbi:hypothetical protein CHS0354_020053 [Potamilus streckersoni]|uniref:Uncharacterized protein n=1 Tax=Potamilus streckersoni TaxID=2493646 RepID=A0AAE0SC95_9BIVA|nr:hypothetical protein CHS0354_020053 [Potamilus streckersoni]
MAQTATQEIFQNDRPNGNSPESHVIPIYTLGAALAASVRLQHHHHNDVAQKDHKKIISVIINAIIINNN